MYIALKEEQNYLNEMGILTQGWLDKLEKLDLEYYGEEREQVGDIRWICKLETKQLKTICKTLLMVAIKG